MRQDELTTEKQTDNWIHLNGCFNMEFVCIIPLPTAIDYLRGKKRVQGANLGIETLVSDAAGAGLGVRHSRVSH